LETNTITIGTTIRRAVLGLQLGLTTDITADGMITFHIVPTLTRIQREVNIEIPTGCRSSPSSNPVIDLQELATTVRVREGNSFVLAGLISKMRTLKHEGLPYISDLPWVGASCSSTWKRASRIRTGDFGDALYQHGAFLNRKRKCL
jgi:type II secretory pathway component GspD/PulD (secretin)